MKGIDIFCASQASTAIRLMSTMDQPPASSSSSSSSSSSTAHHLGGGRAIDRHNPIIRDARRIPLPVPCTSQPPPVEPIPYKQLHHKGRKSSSNSKPKNDQTKTSYKKSSGTDQKMKSKSEKQSSDGPDGVEIVRKGFDKAGDLVNAPDSSRYLLGEAGLLDLVSDFDPVVGLVPVDITTSTTTKATPAVKTEESSASNSKPPSSSRSPHQVVVLRVSLHCKGCEGKVRKHISRMQGVTSFNIDFQAKKVTVVGDVTPLGVLSSISKVKTAQLWTPPTVSSAPAAASSNYPEIKKNKAVVGF